MTTHHSPRGQAAWATFAATALALTGFLAPAAHAADPVNVALNTGPLAPTVTASYHATWSGFDGNRAIMNNGSAPASSAGFTDAQGWSCWGSNTGTYELLTFTWPSAVTVSSLKIWFQSNVVGGDSGVRIPGSYTVQWADAIGAFHNVTGYQTDYPTTGHAALGGTANQFGPYTSTFDAVATKQVQIRLNRQSGTANNLGMAVTEIELWGEVGGTLTFPPAPDPDPGPPAEYAGVEDVFVRLGVGDTLALPATIWAVGNDGPLSPAVPVTWTSPPASYATAGQYQVSGVAGTDTPVTATIAVAPMATPWSTIPDFPWDVGTVTTPGIAPTCPASVPLEYDDQSVETVAVGPWSSPVPGDYDEPDDLAVLTAPVGTTGLTATCYAFVVAASTDPAPYVFVNWLNAPEGTGWYTSLPEFNLSLERGLAGDPITKVEYSLDGGETWIPYYLIDTEIEKEGSFDLTVRAETQAEHVSVQTIPMRVDRTAPVTAAVRTDNYRQVQVLLDPSDGDVGSGISRTLYAYGTSASATGGGLSMWASYNPDEGIELTRPASGTVYLHWYSEDFAGNREASSNTLTRISLTAYPYYLVSWEMNGNGNPVATTTVSNNGTTAVAAPPAPSAPARTFIGWYADSGLTIPYDFSAPVTGDMTLYAKWAPDTSSLEALLDVAYAYTLNWEMYTESSWADFSAALAQAQIAAGAGSALTEQDLDDATDALTQAMADLTARIDPGAPDVDHLEVMVALARQAVAHQQARDAYTPASFAALTTALTDAEAVLANLADASEVQVRDAVAAVQTAMAGLEPAVSTSTLSELVAYAQGVVSAGQHTAASLARVQTAITDALTVLAGTPTALDLYDAGVALLDALAALEDAVDSTALTALIAFAKSLDPAGFTPASVAALTVKITEAEALVALGDQATPAQVAAAYEALRLALGALEIRAVTTGLTTAIGLAQSIVTHLPLYAPATVAGLGPALVAARAVSNDPNATQDQVDAAESALLAAIMQARFKASTSGLVAAIASAGNVDLSAYTAASSALLVAELGRAHEVLADQNAIQADVDAAVAALVAAMQALRPASEAGGQGGAGAPGGDGAPGAPGAGGGAVAPIAPAESGPVAGVPVPAPASVVLVKAAQSAVTLVKGQSVRLAATAYMSDGAKAAVTWKSSSPKVAKVASNGKITAAKAGKSTITVASPSGKKAKIRVTVLPAKSAKAKVARVSATVPKSMAVGASVSVTGKYAPARAVKAKVRYASSDATVASIDKYGRLIAKAPGKAVITVKAGTKSKAYTVTVG